MSKIRVGVLRGGPSSEYDVSLKTGQSIIDNFSDDYEVSDVLITKNGLWHIGGIETTPIRAMRRNDVFFNGLHGTYGEDGQLQKLLDHHGYAYTGSRKLGSALSMNKLLAKKYFEKAGLKIPRHVSFDKKRDRNTSDTDEAQAQLIEVMKAMRGPWVVKPVAGGSSIGVVVVETHAELYDALLHSLQNNETVFVEEVIRGKEATCGVLDHFRDEPVYALPPLEIIPGGKGFFDYQVKYDGSSQEIPYGSFSSQNISNIQQIARQAHEALGLRHYSRVDVIVTEENEIYALEVNTLPGLTEASLFPRSLKAVDISFSDFLDHVTRQAFTS